MQGRFPFWALSRRRGAAGAIRKMLVFAGFLCGDHSLTVSLAGNTSPHEVDAPSKWFVDSRNAHRSEPPRRGAAPAAARPLRRRVRILQGVDRALPRAHRGRGRLRAVAGGGLALPGDPAGGRSRRPCSSSCPTAACSRAPRRSRACSPSRPEAASRSGCTAGCPARGRSRSSRIARSPHTGDPRRP